MDTSANAIADRVNCYAIGDWIDVVADWGGVPLAVPLDLGQEPVQVQLVRVGVSISLFRHADEALSESDQVVFHRVSFDPVRAVLPFGLNGNTTTPDTAKGILSNDFAGGRAADLKRGDTRISFFLPQDARAIELTFHPTMIGISACQVFRLGGEFPYRDIDRLFGPRRLGR